MIIKRYITNNFLSLLIYWDLDIQLCEVNFWTIFEQSQDQWNTSSCRVTLEGSRVTLEGSLTDDRFNRMTLPACQIQWIFLCSQFDLLTKWFHSQVYDHAALQIARERSSAADVMEVRNKHGSDLRCLQNYFVSIINSCPCQAWLGIFILLSLFLTLFSISVHIVSNLERSFKHDCVIPFTVKQTRTKSISFFPFGQDQQTSLQAMLILWNATLHSCGHSPLGILNIITLQKATFLHETMQLYEHLFIVWLFYLHKVLATHLGILPSK